MQFRAGQGTARKCGRKNCRCADDPAARHAAHLLTSKVGGQTKSIDVPVEPVEEVNRWVRERKRIKRLLKEIDELGERCVQTATTWAVDYLFRRLDPSGRAGIRTGMVRSMINARRLEDYRFEGEYLVAVDGTEQHRFKNCSRPHCPNCLKPTHTNGSTDYFRPGRLS